MWQWLITLIIWISYSLVLHISMEKPFSLLNFRKIWAPKTLIFRVSEHTLNAVALRYYAYDVIRRLWCIFGRRKNTDEEKFSSLDRWAGHYFKENEHILNFKREKFVVHAVGTSDSLHSLLGREYSLHYILYHLPINTCILITYLLLLPSIQTNC